MKTQPPPHIAPAGELVTEHAVLPTEDAGVAIDFGIFLPSPDEGISVAAAARHAEAVGLATLWSGDHLVVDWGFRDAPLALATAAAATEHLKIGLGVYLPALRPPVWAAKHVATLQYLTGGERLELGVGLGGKVGDGPDEWAAAGCCSPAVPSAPTDSLRTCPGNSSPATMPAGANGTHGSSPRATTWTSNRQWSTSSSAHPPKPPTSSARYITPG